jgi:acetylornithine deacetylase/succinyl-diaminopimelate desuccinylase-like protein
MRDEAIRRARASISTGTFLTDLARRVAMETVSQAAPHPEHLKAYLSDEIGPALQQLGFSVDLFENPVAGAAPLLLAQRIEDATLPTLLCYGHGDVVQGNEGEWRQGKGPWQLAVEGDHVYGRGSADNKGQHSVLIAAIQSVLEVRGRLGVNMKILIEMSEETGSTGLREFCASNRERLAANLFIGSDGPRVAADIPTIFLGSRGLCNIELRLKLREGGYHSGNWGGALANPAVILANALSTIIDGRGRIQVPALLPPPIAENVRAAIADCPVGGDADDPDIDPDWGEPYLTTPERVYGWNSLEVLTLSAGNPARPSNAIPPEAFALCQMRFVVGSDWENFASAIADHLNERGFGLVEARKVGEVMLPSRLDPDNPYVRWAVDSITRTLDRRPAVLPNIGGGLPNDIFAEILGLPTLWVPHSYPGCRQHGPDEHALLPILDEGLAMMTGLLWDAADQLAPNWPNNEKSL